MKQTVCDRFHGQKLRCDRDTEDDETCRRCRRAGAVCTYPSYEERSHPSQTMNAGSRDRRANRRSSSSSQVRKQTANALTHQTSVALPSSTSSTFFATPISPPLPPSAKRSLSELDDGLPSPVPT